MMGSSRGVGTAWQCQGTYKGILAGVTRADGHEGQPSTIAGGTEDPTRRPRYAGLKKGRQPQPCTSAVLFVQGRGWLLGRGSGDAVCWCRR